MHALETTRRQTVVASIPGNSPKLQTYGTHGIKVGVSPTISHAEYLRMPVKQRIIIGEIGLQFSSDSPDLSLAQELLWV
ncbi:hypothetical protein AAJCM20276_26820 [Acetobacter aceti]|uniref:Uncharacterized protein n=1 Tax=Acetobacter aceti TaxID=435 RepID=A0A6S6PJP9_ACEAC|nr:hypothetical protein AAJCM20276_26820 [Acetobacter aceti]